MIKGKDFIGIGVGAVILNERNEVLMLHRKREPNFDHWHLPGGSVELFEKVEECVIREVKEEVGLNVLVNTILDVVNSFYNDSHWISLVYSVKVVDGIAKNMEPNKHYDIKWFDIEKIPENTLFLTKDEFKSVFKKALQYK